MRRRKTWRVGGVDLLLDRTLVMGILNVTPDSFSDGGRFGSVEEAVAAGLAMLAEGAVVIDVGGESTRPGSAQVEPAEEVERVLPVVSALAEAGALVSVDTRHAEVAEACISAGAGIINDVSGFGDPRMAAAVAASDAGCVVMHMRGEPRTMQEAPHYDDVVADVRDYLAGQARMLEGLGVSADRIALDPGIGFGKSTEHNLALLRGLPTLAALGYPVLVGVSRKRFIGELTGVSEPALRLEGSLAAAVWCAGRGADVVRVHDVRAHVAALRVADALMS